ncbi:MAG: DUF1761 domain-containing protein [Candidatus Eremiobacteraeota bacterium]|nr:DUF1761 domain-containing protein [Candidatus Eremiobacteraeota bacterium]
MPMQKVNWGAVIVGAIAFWVWGAIWFTLLKVPYAAAVGFTADQQAAYAAHPSPVPYILSFVAALVLSMGTAIALADSNQPGAAHGVQFGMFMGIIVFATNFLSITLFMMKPWSLWLIECGYVIIGMMIVGGIIGAWRKKAATV